MNPEFHDEFVALCALYYSGEISEEEWALLQIHMAYCDSCHENFLQYQRITSDVIPAMAAVAASELGHAPPRESARTLEAAERRLMTQLDSSPARPEAPRQRRSGWRLPGALIAACGLVLASVLGVELIRIKSRPDANATQAPTHPQAAQASGGPPRQDLQQALQRSQEKVASLEQQVMAADDRVRQANFAMTGIEKQLGAEKNAKTQLSEERDGLSRQLTATQTELDGLRGKGASEG